MRKLLSFFTLCFISLLTLSAQTITTPEQSIGFAPGTDRMLFKYEQLTDYLKTLDEESDRIKMVEVGHSALGKTMFICFISSPENIANLDKLKEINRRLAIDAAIPSEEKNKMIEDGKIFFLATLSMHSTEVGPSQSAPVIAYDLATTNDPQKLEWLNDVVYMMVPCHNPDGMDMVVEHYMESKDTPYEGSSLPRVYHKYVGHNINRDFVTLSQPENKAVAKIYNLDWFPQVMVEKHQMGSTGPRYYVPPNHDPIAENVDEGIWNWTGIFGMNMMTDMTKNGLAGVSQHYIFDDYWPGSTETCIWKNVIGFLTEAASAQTAKPIFVEPTELEVGGKGLAEYKKSINMPLPWKGGWWRLSDLVDYELYSTLAILKTCSNHRKDILAFRNDLCVKEVNKGKTEPPYYYIMPNEQNDLSEMVGIVNLMKEHGINVYELTKDVFLGSTIYKKGAVVIPLAQAFRPFVKEVMEKQNFPLRHYTPDGEAIKPYDITTWSLPLHRGVKSDEIKIRSEELEESLAIINDDYNLADEENYQDKTLVFSSTNNESYKVVFESLAKGVKIKQIVSEQIIEGHTIPAGSFTLPYSSKLDDILNTLSVSPITLSNDVVVKSKPVTLPRIALVETIFHDMDAGWTRYIFDDYHIPYNVVSPADFKDIDFAGKYDLVIFPDRSKELLMTGKYKYNGQYSMSSYPPELVKGIGKDGFEKLMTYVDKGGIILSWGNSTDLFDGMLNIKHGDDTEEFELPFDNIASSLGKKGVYLPGALVKLKLVKDHPLTYGLGEDVNIFYRARPVFSTSVPRFDMDRRVIGYLPEENILVSGYAEEVEKLGNKSAMIWLRKGKGQFVLMAFNPQFRASTQGTYKLLFNSLLLDKLEQ